MNQPLQTLAKLAETVGVDYSAINSDEMIIQTAEAALKRIEELHRAVLEEIEHRDDHAEYADMLAGEIARFFEIDIGEHSSANFPWDNAFDAIPDTTLAALRAQWRVSNAHALQLKPSIQQPDYEAEPDAAYLLLNPCDGFHIAYGNFDHDEQKFERFSNFSGGQTYTPDSYIAWARLPDALKIIESTQEAGDA